MICKTKNGKGFTDEMIQNRKELAIDWARKLFNMLFEGGIVLEDWRTTKNVVHIYSTLVMR